MKETHYACIHSAEDASYKLVAAIKQHRHDPSMYQFKLIQHISDTRPTWTPREILDINIHKDGLELLVTLINYGMRENDPD